MKIKNIAVLTSGGDAPGMNATIRAVTRYALGQNINVFGVNRGYTGLRNGDIFQMNLRTVSDILHRGGTILYSARDSEFLSENGVKQAVETCKKNEIDVVVAIGGNGTLNGIKKLSDRGIKCMFVPASIDNDMPYTEYAIGFDTATNTAVEMVDKIRDTTQSHEKCSVVEVMGRHCGDIALFTGISVGATAIIVPEIECDFEKDVIERIKITKRLGKRHFIVIVSENCFDSSKIAKSIEEKTGVQTRCTILGHVQRGGSPTIRDRVVASLMGCKVVDNILDKKFDKAIALRCDKVINVDIDEALKCKKNIDLNLYVHALQISI